MLTDRSPREDDDDDDDNPDGGVVVALVGCLLPAV
jgi:hypothetical protein